ncbi:MAG: hypothetical protein PHX78_09775 [bacterium]|nr:hypothetical protein [bacterium]
MLVNSCNFIIGGVKLQIIHLILVINVGAAGWVLNPVPSGGFFDG